MKLTDLNLITEHPSCYLADEVAEVCKPLFEKFPINYFGYGYKYRSSGGTESVVWVCSNKAWLFHYLQGGYKFLINGKKIDSWGSTMEYEALKNAADSFDHHNGAFLCKKDRECIECIEVACPNPRHSPLEFCYNTELLNQFVMYFKDKARGILKVLDKEPIVLSSDRFKTLENPDQHYDNFCEAIKTKEIPLKFRSQEINITRREFEVLSQLAKGKTMKEIATMLKVSPRTVEVHLYNAKIKTNCFTMSSLVDAFTENLF